MRSNKKDDKTNILTYKGYQAKVCFDAEAKVLYGVIEDIPDLIDFISLRTETVEEEFHKAVDDYLDFCREQGKAPEIPYKGLFQVRTTPDTHKQLVRTARSKGIALNTLVNEILTAYLN